MGWRVAHRLRIFLLLVFFLLTVSLILWADKLSTERLIERATTDGIAEFREANSKALVAGYIILGRPLDDLVGPAQEAIQTRGYRELWNALEAGREGNHIDICYRPQEFEDYLVGGRRLSQMTMEELEQLTFLEGTSNEVRQAAATLLIRRRIEAVGVEIRSWYAFRIEHEIDLFDPLKKDLQEWQSWSLGQSPELAAATVLPLAQMYLAEHFVWWEWENGGKGRYHAIIQGQLECPENA